jgi:hypothetical protein
LLGFILLFAITGCDEAKSKFDQAQRDEQFQYADGALKKYFDIVQNHKDSDVVGPSQDKLYEMLKARTRDFTNVDVKAKEVMDYFSRAYPATKLGKISSEVEAKMKVREEIISKYTKFFEKLTIEDYTDMTGYFSGGKVIEDLLDKLARRESRGGMIVQGYRFVDFIPEGGDRAGMLVARQEYFPENGTTGEVKYRLHCSKQSVGWVITSMEIIR